MSVKLLSEQHLEFLSLKVGCTGCSESIHVKMPHCWKSHVAAQIILATVLDICFILPLLILYGASKVTSLLAELPPINRVKAILSATLLQ